MTPIEKRFAARRLIDAHAALVRARLAAAEAATAVCEAERAYIGQPADAATAVLCEGHLLILKDEYYDHKPGEQVEVLPVEVLA
jgi:hypothetical protein